MYKHLFFDLDHTLWDFDRNSAESIAEIYEQHRLGERGVPSAEHFAEVFIGVNRRLWADFDFGRVTHGYIREHRFPLVFREMGVADVAICPALNDDYLRLLPRKAHLTDAARDLLEHLQGRYRMHIITNGFDEIQAVKLASADIAHFFEHVITNERAGAKKPDARIFQYALDIGEADVADSLMLGDNYEADILGAQAVGIATLFYNPKQQPTPQPPTYNIAHWREALEIL